MARLVICLVLLACTKESAKPARAPEPMSPRAAPAAVTPVGVHLGPVQTTAKALFDDFTRPDGDGLALLDKYRDGATFTATIKTVGAEEDGSPVVWIDIDGENMMTLDFAAPPQQELRAGRQLKVTCKIGGASGALMMVTQCTDS